MTKLRNSKAFTLIELVAVIIILGILALIALFAYNTIITNSRVSTLNAGGTQVGTSYKADLGVDAKGANVDPTATAPAPNYTTMKDSALVAAKELAAANSGLKVTLGADATATAASVINVAISDENGNCTEAQLGQDPAVAPTWTTFSGVSSDDVASGAKITGASTVVETTALAGTCS